MYDINRIVPFENNSLKSILLTNRKNEIKYEIVDENAFILRPSSMKFQLCLPVTVLCRHNNICAFIATHRSTVLFVFFCVIIRNS